MLALLLLAGTTYIPVVTVTTPRDVAKWVERREACEHFAGEEPYDKPRARFLKRQIERLRCERLEADRARLRAKYRGRESVLTQLEGELPF